MLRLQIFHEETKKQKRLKGKEENQQILLQIKMKD